MTLAARLRPVGSVNVATYSKSRGLSVRRLLEVEAIGARFIDESGHETTNLGALYAGGSCPLGSGVPHVAHLQEATASLHYVEVAGFDEKMHRHGSSMPRIMTHTTEGDMLLPPETVIVWLPRITD